MEADAEPNSEMLHSKLKSVGLEQQHNSPIYSFCGFNACGRTFFELWEE